MSNPGITAVPGINVGHYTDPENATGCTVVLCEDGAVGGVDVRGSAPGTRETDLLSPTAMVDRVHAVLLSGGSAFGLAAATGVVEYLEEKGVGIEFGNATIPIVPAAILFDLGMVTHEVRPDARAGRLACEASHGGEVAEGTVGAGTGATVVKLLGRDRCIKGGIGTASVHLGNDVTVGAIVAVNAVGGVVDPETSQIVAGPLSDDGVTMLDSMSLITSPDFEGPQPPPGENTTIGVVATNATLTKSQANKLAAVAHDGLAMAVRPAHLMSDGDTIFALSTRQHEGPVNMNRLCAATAVSVSRAIVRAVQKATGLDGVKSVSELSE
ncbi:MAG: P1 family peptidase [Dehalococcoidia bacterium]|nr:P1 family peptidase [Dehalococcoidia bacterium]